jgi:hypothetical protein
MRRLTLHLVACMAILAFLAPSARADFGLFGFDLALTEANGTPAIQAGSHPFALTTSFGINFDEDEKGVFSEGRIKDFLLRAMPGLAADTTALPPCSSLDFFEDADNDNIPDCPVESQVGITAASSDVLGWRSSPVFTVSPPPGVLLRLGWSVGGVASIVVDVGVSTEQPYNGLAASRNTPQTVEVIGVKAQLWGDPTDFRHDELRGSCLEERREGFPLDDVEGFQFEGTGGSCPVSRSSKPFLTLPTYCGGPLLTSYEAVSWNDLDADGVADRDTGSVLTAPLSLCGALPAFDPTISAKPTSKAAESPSGLDFALQIDDEGLVSNKPEARAKSRIRRVVVTLPEGMTANPSLAEGLEVCSEAQLAKETLSSAPGEGCPQASKIGTIEVDSPLVPETVDGALYQAEPFANLAEDSLIAFYIVLENRKLGILVKQPVKVEADPRTGQLRATTDEIPQLPFSSFQLKFREGGRSPLITPPSCGTHTVRAQITPWSGGPVAESISPFQVVSGPDEGPCPANGSLPFDPGFAAGSVNNAAGAFSPFAMRITRRDGDQDLTRFDAKLPPGVVAKLAGVSRCSDAEIATAKAKTGRAELANPSCPAASRIGRVVSGAGVGSQLAYVSGTVYLAGPFAGAPLSAVGIVPAVAGPFDVGTVVVRQAIVVDPVTGEVTADGSRSDPIPHILAGIPLRVRDIQVHVDRPSFTINPTNCDPMATGAQIWGGGLDPFSVADNRPVPRSSRYQAADCARLGFRPRLSLRLLGGTRRGAHPSLRGVLRPRPGDANIERTVVRLPRSAFLDQGHIRTICTRVQFAADKCPKGAAYGHVTVFTPLLDEPLRGPVYLRSSDNELPDLVFDLKGLVDIEAVARIDSIRGGIRATFAAIPDAPISKAIVRMQGGDKGLIVNSTNLCRSKSRADVQLEAHSGKQVKLRPLVKPQCKKKGKAR